MESQKVQKISRVEHILAHIASLYLSPLFADVFFVLSGGEKIPAHKSILGVKGSTFPDLFQSQDTNEINLDVDSTSFKIILKYFYTGIIEKLDVKTAIDILNFAILYNVKNLINICELFLSENADKMLNHESFSSLSEVQKFKDEERIKYASVIHILSSDWFVADELLIFNSVTKWSGNNEDKAKEVMKYIRLELIDPGELTSVVRPTKLVNELILLDLLDNILNKRLTKIPREKILYDVNLASTEMGAKVLEGENRQFLLNGNTGNYDVVTGFTSCKSRKNYKEGVHYQGIMVELKEVLILNYIRILLNEADKSARYSYYIEVSEDKENWTKVIDYKDYPCRSWQELYFTRQRVKYINIVGTWTSWTDDKLKVVSLEAKCKRIIPNYKPGGILYPTQNIATTNCYATIICPSDVNGEECLMGHFQSYGHSFGFTSVKLNQALIIHFNQPYAINSLKFLLLDCDDRTYSYQINTTSKRSDAYTSLVNKRKEKCKSWQTFEFEERIVTCLMFRGTASSASDSLDIIYVECPMLKDTSKGIGELLNKVDILSVAPPSFSGHEAAD